MIARGEIRAAKLGTRRLIPVTEVDRILATAANEDEATR